MVTLIFRINHDFATVRLECHEIQVTGIWVNTHAY